MGYSSLMHFRNISHDPNVYPNPEISDPDRFKPLSDLDLKSSRVPPLDPQEYIFGYGQRICPGLNLVQATAWLAIAGFLALFELCFKDSGATFKSEVTYDGIVW